MSKEIITELKTIAPEYAHWRAVYRELAPIHIGGNPVNRMVNIAFELRYVNTMADAQDFAERLADIDVYTQIQGHGMAEEVDLKQLSETVCRPEEVLKIGLDVFTRGGGIKSRRIINNANGKTPFLP